MSTDIIVRFTDSYVQKLGDIKKVVGLMSPKSLIQIIDTLDLDANPRNSRLGSVTDAIQASIRADELSPAQKLFPFKSKGILLASSSYEPLERGRYRLSFTPHDEVEGILDGGHNTLAIGSYILSEAELALGNRPPPKRAKFQSGTHSNRHGQFVEPTLKNTCRSSVKTKQPSKSKA